MRRIVLAVGLIGGVTALGSALWAQGAGGPASQPAAVPDFTVQPVLAPFQLSAARGQWVVLHFLLKTECPVCLRYTHSYASRAAELPGVVQVFLKPDDEAEIAKWASRLPPGPARPVIYRDADAAVARQLGIPDGYKFHGEVVHYPALVLIDPDGREVFRYVGKNNGDRLSWDAFAKKLAELQQARGTK